MNVRRRFRPICFIAAILCGLLAPVFAGAEELFGFRFQTKDGRRFWYSIDRYGRSIVIVVTRMVLTPVLNCSKLWSLLGIREIYLSSLNRY
jgi:hypothetical protein